MACKPSCQLCRNLVISQSITLVTVDGTDTLVVDLPARAYNDGCKVCIIFAQAIPNVPINTPVAFSIGGDTTTVYPFVRCDCSEITVCAIRTRTRYSTRVETSATSGVFKSLGGLKCCPTNNLESLPVPTTTATTFSVRELADNNKLTKTTTTTTKEVIARE
jgi:hypothetical protein